MSKKKINKRNFKKVLVKIQEQFDSNDWYKDVYIEAFNIMLDTMAGEDTFGTERQCDPRGDQRD